MAGEGAAQFGSLHQCTWKTGALVVEGSPVMGLHVRDTERRKRALPDASMDAIAALPEDVQLMIFSRVGNIKDLFRFAVTCRWWVHRFTDPAFLRGLSKGNRGCLIGFFFQKTRFKFCTTMMKLRTTEGASVSAPTFVLSPWSPLIGPAERSLTAFIPDHDGTFNYAKPLEARHGIVLMQLVPRNFDRAKLPVLLSLCNPITGEYHFLPPLETPHSPPLGSLDYLDVGPQVTMNAIITAADSSNLDGGLQLLITTTGFGQVQVYLHSYSVGTRSWSTPTRWLELEGSRYSLVLDRAAVVHSGAAHWLCTDRKAHQDDENLYKLSVEVGTTRISMTKLPFHFHARGSRLLCVNKDGKLSVTCIYVMHVTLWTQQECREEGDDTPAGAAPWLRTVIRITPDPNYFPLTESDACRWFGFRDGSLLVLNKLNEEQQSYRIFILDLEKKEMEEVKDSFVPAERNNRENLTFVPYEMDLVKFFVLRLGGICEEPHHL